MENPLFAFHVKDQTLVFSYLPALGVDPFLFLLTPTLLEGNVFLKLVPQALQLFLGRVFKLLQTLRVSFFNFRRQPKSFGEIEAGDADYHDDQQYLSEPLKVAHQADNGATEKITCAAEH